MLTQCQAVKSVLPWATLILFLVNMRFVSVKWKSSRSEKSPWEVEQLKFDHDIAVVLTHWLTYRHRRAVDMLAITSAELQNVRRPKLFRSALVSLYRITVLLKALPTCALCLFKGLWSFWIKFQTAVSSFFSIFIFSSLNAMLIWFVLLSKRFRRPSETTTMSASNVTPPHCWCQAAHFKFVGWKSR